MTKPSELQTLATLTLISGIVNLLFALAGTIGILIMGAFTLGIGCCFLPFPILQGVAGYLEIRYAQELSPDPPRVSEPNKTVAIIEIVCVLGGNLLAVVTGVLALVWYEKPEVKAYFASLSAPPPVPPVPPVA
jgi:hypothetical protein